MVRCQPPPALPPILSEHLTGSGMQKVLEAARDAGLFADASYTDFCGVADVGTTTFTTNVEGAQHVVSVYALGMEGCTDHPTERATLAAFLGKLTDLSWLEAEMDTVGPIGPFAFSSLAVLVDPYAPYDDPTLPQQEVAWPLSSSLASFGEPTSGLETRCGVVSGADLEALRPLLDTGNQMTPWTSDGERWHLMFRPLLPAALASKVPAPAPAPGAWPAAKAPGPNSTMLNSSTFSSVSPNQSNMNVSRALMRDRLRDRQPGLPDW